MQDKLTDRNLVTRNGSPIVEIGHLPYFKRVMPSQTIFIAVGKQHELADYVIRKYDLLSLRQLYFLLNRDNIRLIVCRINNNPKNIWRIISRIISAIHFKSNNSIFSTAQQYIGTKRRTPLAVLDFEDEGYIHPTHRNLLASADLIFKRELPVDRWHLLRPSEHKSIHEPSFRRNRASRELIEKFRPLPLGLPLNGFSKFIRDEKIAKSSDVFFAGAVEHNAWIRKRGYAELLELKGRGIILDLPTERIEPQEFYERCARSRLVWSPPGYGWDCFRHYEAAACRAVPLMSYPTIERHEGLRDQEHALFYDPSPGGLSHSIIEALRDHAILENIAEAARSHVKKHLTPEAIVDYIVSSVENLHR